MGSGWLPAARILGIDLAWGTKNPDGIAEIRFNGVANLAELVTISLSHGDHEILTHAAPDLLPTLIAIDAPIVCQNQSGARPVDKLTHTQFGKYHAGCHPANLTLTPRPPALLKKLQDLGYLSDWNLQRSNRLAIEVYPHPAMVRWFQLEQILKYKRPPTANRRAEFLRYQKLFREFLDQHLPWFQYHKASEVFTSPWSKPIEDQLDALLCATIGLWHLHFHGLRSQVLGDLESGFLVIPRLAENAPA